MFNIGDKVVCIDDTMQPHTIEELTKDVPNWIKKGETYTIRGYTSNKGIVDAVWLEEITNPPKFFKLTDRVQEPAFALWRFRKTEQTTIEHSLELNVDITENKL